MSKKLVVDIVSDVICPWCYVGKRRLEKAIKLLQPKHSDVSVEMRWHPFFLDPELPKEGVDKLTRYRQKFGARVPQMLEHMKQVGLAEGIRFSFGGGKIANPLDAHRVLELAKGTGKQDTLMEVLFRCYFEEEKNIGDVDVLVAAAEEAGVAGARELLDTEEGVAEVRREARKWATGHSVTGVPVFVFQSHLAVSGAQDPATLLSAMEQALA